jgi:RNA polymerase sigma-70 factor (ECF subfamily)
MSFASVPEALPFAMMPPPRVPTSSQVLSTRVSDEPVGERPGADGSVGSPTRLEPKLRLKAMFENYHVLIWRTLRRSGASSDAASDAVQQAYLIAAERLDDIRYGCERAFLFRTAVTLTYTKNRRERRCELEQDMDGRFERPSPGDELARRHYARQLLDTVLASMDDDLVTVFSLFELEGLTVPEISEMLEIPTGTVASRLRRSRALFRSEAERLERTSKGGR